MYPGFSGRGRTPIVRALSLVATGSPALGFRVWIRALFLLGATRLNAVSDPFSTGSGGFMF